MNYLYKSIRVINYIINFDNDDENDENDKKTMAKMIT